MIVATKETAIITRINKRSKDRHNAAKATAQLQSTHTQCHHSVHSTTYPQEDLGLLHQHGLQSEDIVGADVAVAVPVHKPVQCDITWSVR
jgi:hypothetical protein